MAIELIQRPMFDLKIGETVFKEFTVLSEWEGFKKLSSPKHGTVIVATEAKGEYSKLLDALIPEKAGKDKIFIIKGPVDVLAALEREHAKGGA